MRIAVVPQVPNLLMNPPNIIVVAHYHLVGGGFEAGVPTVPNDIFRESRKSVVTDMLVTAGKAYDIEPAGTECPRLSLPVPIAWRDNCPPHNVRGGLWGRGRCRMGGVDVSGGRQIAAASRGCRMGGVDASGGGGIAAVSRGCWMVGVDMSGGGQIAIASRGLVTIAPINALRGAAGLECPGEGGLAESGILTAG